MSYYNAARSFCALPYNPLNTTDSFPLTASQDYAAASKHKRAYLARLIYNQKASKQANELSRVLFTFTHTTTLSLSLTHSQFIVSEQTVCFVVYMREDFVKPEGHLNPFTFKLHMHDRGRLIEATPRLSSFSV